VEGIVACKRRAPDTNAGSHAPTTPEGKAHRRLRAPGQSASLVGDAAPARPLCCWWHPSKTTPPNPSTGATACRTSEAGRGFNRTRHGVAGTSSDQRHATHRPTGRAAFCWDSELAEALALNTLTNLSLEEYALDAAAHELAGALGRKSTLTELGLGWNNLGEDEKTKLAVVVSVSNNNIHAEGVRHLAQALLRNNTLQELTLTTNGVGDNGARYLATPWNGTPRSPFVA
jgi:hypothetical protein